MKIGCSCIYFQKTLAGNFLTFFIAELNWNKCDENKWEHAMAVTEQNVLFEKVKLDIL